MLENTFAHRPPVIALIGRTNVGKSTLFNHLSKTRKSIINEEGGSTRDRIYGSMNRENQDYVIIDSGGLEKTETNSMQKGIERQALKAADEADVVLMLVDAKEGLLKQDYEIAKLLRLVDKPKILVANKADNDALGIRALAVHELGIGDVCPVSAAQGIGVSHLMDVVNEKLGITPVPEICHASEGWHPDELDDLEGLDPSFRWDDNEEDEDEAAEETSKVTKLPDVFNIALIGRPNVGKSSLVNKLLGDDRCLVSEIPGTTMDAVDLELEFGAHKFQLIDTAGIRRKRSVYKGLEKQAIARTLNAIDRSHVSVLMLDPIEGITEQDMKVAAFANDKGKGILIVVNKWDLARAQGMNADEFTKKIRDEMPFVAFAPIRFVSALKGTRVFDVLESAVAVAEEYFKRVSTGQLNKWLQMVTDAHEPPIVAGCRIKLKFMTQVTVAPPTFLFSCNNAKGLHFSYKRFLTNRMRMTFGFKGSPIRFVFRSNSDDRKKKKA